MLRPILKWPGGKSWLIPLLAEYWREAPGARLVEPFAGGLSVALGLRPAQALIADANAHLINLYTQIRGGLEIEIALENDSALYYSHRDRFNALIAQGRANSPEGASLFYFLNRTGFNGLCRFNKKGFYNVPFGRYTRIGYRRTFEEYRAAFQGWEFQTADFASLAYRPDDLIYADPPYDATFTQYAQGGFRWADQLRLAFQLWKHPGKVLASNSATTRIIREYFGLGFAIQFLDAPRRISCNGNRASAREILARRRFGF